MITIHVPEGFAELPLDDDPTRRRERLVALAEEAGLLMEVDTAEVERGGESIAEQARARDVRVLGRFAVDTDDGPALATLAIAVQRLRPPRVAGPAFTDRALEELLARVAARPHSDARRLDLPGGPALGRVIAEPLPEVEFLVPTPRWDALVAVSVTASDVAAWPAVSRAAVDLARTLRFDAPTATDRQRVLAT